VQEIVDVPFADAPRAVRTLHRLAGAMNFLLRNDPGLHARAPLLSVRPLAWRHHVPRHGRFAADSRMVLTPAVEIDDWRSYLALLWDGGPMFLVGTKSDGMAWVPEHPTFMEFLRGAARGWDGRLLDGTAARVFPETSHAAASDWSYMGYARIRWKWRADGPAPADIVEAWDRGRIEDLLQRSLVKVVVENRCNATQPEGEEMVSVALVAGLLANLNDAARFTASAPHAFWRQLLDASIRLPLRSVVEGRSVPELAAEMIAIARAGLVARGEPDPDRWLAPLRRRIDEGASPSERRLRQA
jgi:hypothetical protein